MDQLPDGPLGVIFTCQTLSDHFKLAVCNRRFRAVARTRAASPMAVIVPPATPIAISPHWRPRVYSGGIPSHPELLDAATCLTLEAHRRLGLLTITQVRSLTLTGSCNVETARAINQFLTQQSALEHLAIGFEHYVVTIDVPSLRSLQIPVYSQVPFALAPQLRELKLDRLDIPLDGSAEGTSVVRDFSNRSGILQSCTRRCDVLGPSNFVDLRYRCYKRFTTSDEDVSSAETTDTNKSVLLSL